MEFRAKVGGNMVKLAEQANSSYSLIVKRESFLGPNFMSEIRFIAKGGQSVDGAIVCQRFFEVAITSGLKPDHASAVWHDAMHGDAVVDPIKPDTQRVERECTRGVSGS